MASRKYSVHHRIVPQRQLLTMLKSSIRKNSLFGDGNYACAGAAESRFTNHFDNFDSLRSNVLPRQACERLEMPTRRLGAGGGRAKA